MRCGTPADAGGLAATRGALIDDVPLGRLIKRHGGRCRPDLIRDVVSRRPYPPLADLWVSAARSACTRLRYPPPPVAGTVLGLPLSFAVPPVAWRARSHHAGRVGTWKGRG